MCRHRSPQTMITANTASRTASLEMRMCSADDMSGAKPQTWLSRCFGGIGMTAGLLLPKCPLCWFAIAGTGISGAGTKLSVELLGILVFSWWTWKMVRFRRWPLMATLGITVGIACISATGAWFVASFQFRLFLWGLLAVAATLIGRPCCAIRPRVGNEVPS